MKKVWRAFRLGRASKSLYRTTPLAIVGAVGNHRRRANL
jgi:hypothetical protein